MRRAALHLAFLAAAMLCTGAVRAGGIDQPGVPLTGGTLTGPLTISPPYGGTTLLGTALTFNAPSPLTGSYSFGFGPTTEEQFNLRGTGTGFNLFAVTQTDITKFATMIFRGKDSNYADPTLEFEHGAIGWVPALDSMILEASRVDGNSSPLYPPPQITLFQSGGVDPTGGTAVTCATASGSANITCVGAGGANGTLITGAGIPVATVVSSGGGTVNIVASKTATATSAGVSLNFSSPVYAQRKVLDATQTGNVNFRDFINGIILTIDRVHDRIGINTTTPSVPLDVNGAANVNGTLSFSGAGSVTGGGGLPLSLVAGNHIVQNTDNINGIAEINIANASAGASAQASYNGSTGTANSNFLLSLRDQGGTPLLLFSVGSAVTNTLWRAPAFQFQDQAGSVTAFKVLAATGADFPIAKNDATGGLLTNNAGSLTINPVVNTIVGTGSALATNATAGMLLIPSMAGTPTGNVGALGQVALNYDSANKKLCVTIGATVECTAAMTP